MAPSLPPDDLDLVDYVWAADRPIHRIHGSIYDGDTFNPSSAPSRFRPVFRGKTVVPTLYGGEGFDSALSETVFHDVPLVGVRAVPISELVLREYSIVFPTRDLRLAELHGNGLRRLGLRQADIIDFDDLGYRITKVWGQRIYEWRNGAGEPLDGISWMSRQFNSEMAVMLFGSLRGAARVRAADLRIDRGTFNVPLMSLHDDVNAAAVRAGITITLPGVVA